ncbi:hypothetical protein GIR35_12370 [Enterococcus faecalis]|nr:hypothetical protein GIR35_12370 [Enterococcus faecalis]
MYKEERDGKKKTVKKRKILLVSALAALACLTAGSAYLYDGNPPEQGAHHDDAPQRESSNSYDYEKSCAHDWTVTYKTVHHDAVTHTENVAPVYEQKTSYHTVCNECLQIIDGAAEQHIKDSGHSGYSTKVPITGEFLMSEGYSHEVTDTPAYDETVPVELACTICGETRPDTVTVN